MSVVVIVGLNFLILMHCNNFTSVHDFKTWISNIEERDIL